MTEPTKAEVETWHGVKVDTITPEQAHRSLQRWIDRKATMSVPVRPDDDDVVLSAFIDQAIADHTRGQELKTALEDLYLDLAGGAWHSRACVDAEESADATCFCGGEQRRQQALDAVRKALEPPAEE